MVAIRVITSASIQRNPRPCSASTISTSVPVIKTPASSGMPKSSFSATAEPRTSADVGGPVSRVHITDRHQIAGSGERQHFAKERSAAGNGDAAIDLRQGGQHRDGVLAGRGPKT